MRPAGPGDGSVRATARRRPTHRTQTALFSAAVILVAIPATLYLGTKLPGRWYYLTSTLVVVETMLPFFFSFESRRPQTRELVTVAVMSALAAVSRAAFAFLPGFKPITGIIMIAGIAFGAEAGFLTGAVAAFASNFFFGQGPWTPWQMMAYGLGGFLAGAVFGGGRDAGRDVTADAARDDRRGERRRKARRNPAVLAVFGFLAIMLVVGPLLDCCSVFTMITTITPATVLGVFAAGFPINLRHAVSCALTVLILGRPLLDKLERLKLKYGVMDGAGAAGSANACGTETRPPRTTRSADVTPEGSEGSCRS